MVVAYTMKGLQLTDEQKEYLEKRMQKFKFFYDHILNIKVIAEESRGRISLEITKTFLLVIPSQHGKPPVTALPTKSKKKSRNSKTRK